MDTSKILIDLDSLLDTRQAALYNLVPDVDKLGNFLVSEEYNFRNRDNFSIVDTSRYLDVYSNRTKEILSDSSITYLLSVVESKVRNIEKRNTYYSKTSTPEIVLNVYPYKLTTEESNHIRSLLFHKLHVKTVVTVVYMPYDKITPYYLKTSNTVCVFLYSFTDWINENKVAIENVQVPDTIMYFPSLYSEELIESELKVINDMGFSNLFSYVEFILSKNINVNFLPMVFYSSIVTASLYASKMDKELDQTKHTKFSKGDADGDISPEV